MPDCLFIPNYVQADVINSKSVYQAKIVYTNDMDEPAITQINLVADFIDLGMGNPDLDLLPLELLRQSAGMYFDTGDPRSLQYGAEQGDGYFRRALAEFLTRSYGTGMDVDRLFVTAGASSGLDLICTLYTRPGEVIFVEEPSYFLALRIFEDHGLNAVPIPMDERGMQVDVLEAKLSELKPKFIYTVPTFQNPSGRTLSQARRDKLVEIAQRENFLILADEVYHFLQYNHDPPEPFAIYTEHVEQVISINSFSKILAPGLRLGWILAHPKVIKRLAGSGLLDSGGGMNPFSSAVVRGLVESGGLEENIAHLRTEYARRLNTLDAALHQHLQAAEYNFPEGGFFFWVRLPGVDATELRRKAREFKVDLRQGALFSSQSGLREYFRLSFCHYAPETLEEGVRRLRDALEKQ